MPEQAKQSVGRNVVSASLFMIGLRMTFRVIGLFNSLLLIHLLLPNDFGLVGLAMAFASSLETLTETSFGLALIRLPVMTRQHLDTAWTFQLIRGLVIAGILAGSAGFAADWMREPRVEPIMWVIAATSFLQGFENVGMVEFRRNLQFGKIFEVRLYSKLIGLAVMLPIAAIFHTYWALVAGIVTGRLANMLLSYIWHPYRPRPSLACWRELFHFSKWLFFGNVLWVIDAFTPTMLFGRFVGPTGVGLYQVSYQVASLPASEIAAPIREPIYSGYAKLLNQTAKLRQQYVSGFGVLLLIITPMSVGIALTAELLTPIGLGSQWSAAAPLITPCALFALLDAISHFPGNLFVVLNRQKGFILTLAAMLCIRIPLFVWAASAWGMVPAIYVLVATSGLATIVWTHSVMRLIDISFRELMAPIWRTAVSTVVMATVLLAFANLEAGSDPYGVLLLRLLAVSACGAALQIGTQLLLWLASGAPEGPETKLLGLIRSFPRKLSAIRLRARGAPAA
jgi:O-antigen/teichoic acid export membrane protein